ncbi:CBU_0592 family membrane protein [Pedobacter foliorum]
MLQIIISSIGWLGVILCTLGYLLLSVKVVTPDSLSFQLLNIVGGLCLVTTALETNDLPNAMANLLWMFIGLYALGRRLRTQNAIRKNRSVNS